MARHDPVIAIT